MNRHLSFPKLHNATWPGLVGKGPDSEPVIDLETMLALTAAAQVEDHAFDGVDLMLLEPHVSIDATNDNLKRLTEEVQTHQLVIGSLAAPVWPATNGGSAMGDSSQRQQFLTQVHKACCIGEKLRQFGVRPYGAVRIDSACNPVEWAADPLGNTSRIVETFTTACQIALDHGEHLAAEGEICWGAMHSWKKMVDLLQRVDQPNFGFQADMAHTLLYLLGYNASEDALLPADFDWEDETRFNTAYQTMTNALRPWTIDFHVAQSDATVLGMGTHDKTGRHCLPHDPQGKLDISNRARYWLRNEQGNLTKQCQHICWDGCMFPNQVLRNPETWNEVLAAMVSVRNAHGWSET